MTMGKHMLSSFVRDVHLARSCAVHRATFAVTPLTTGADMLMSAPECIRI